MEREPIKKDMVEALLSCLTPIQKMVLKISAKDIDLDFGRGIVNATSHKLWNKDGYRFDIDVMPFGGLAVGRSKEPDSYYLENAKG